MCFSFGTQNERTASVLIVAKFGYFNFACWAMRDRLRSKYNNKDGALRPCSGLSFAESLFMHETVCMCDSTQHPKQLVRY